jgi:hypothetical protein
LVPLICGTSQCVAIRCKDKPVRTGLQEENAKISYAKKLLAFAGLNSKIEVKSILTRRKYGKGNTQKKDSHTGNEERWKLFGIG